ncbi:gem-associated protein 8-like [Zerene cesonia]|uniref:gem-associated protein 8-like n=1 Tax=Zerene cesonia TaxID=33412 RepID=UPI0018E50D51|nr:gem-associated protein 8-like [Zerene cesonia]
MSMNCQVENNTMSTNRPQPDEPSNIVKKLPNKKAWRQKRKRLNKQGRKEFKRNNKLSFTMSTWAETFTLASNWQIKHQLAYWKARAKALEYENSILHDIIRKNYLGNSSNAENTHVESEPVDQDQIEQTNEEASHTDYDQNDVECAEVKSDDEEGNDFEVSEEFIEFLRTNAKYKEDARIEREKLKAKQQAQEEEQEDSEDRTIMNNEQLKELYGEKWQRISALQMSLMTDFMNRSDESKPVYWPNIPFNFNYS